METIGPYRVLGKLGEGGMAVVYRVMDPHVERELALKLIRLDSGESATAFERFLREAEILGRVRHPNVVRVHSLEREGGVAYLIQEIVAGETLETLVRSGPLEPLRAAQIVRGLADALAAIHREGILHRDLKPANVILRGDDEPILLDFGIARDLNAERLTQTGAVLGTPSYMAPEQAAGEGPSSLGTFTDVYGLGAILYELLTGQPPFSGSSFSVIKAVLTDDPQWPSELSVELPPDLEGILRKAMAKEGSERYADAEALREDLDALLAGRPTQAGGPPVPSGARGWRWGALIAVLGLGLGWGGWISSRPEAAPAPTGEATGTRTRVKPVKPDRRLWRLEVGDRFTYVLEFEERGGVAHTYMKAVLDVRVTSLEGEWAGLAMDMRSLRAGLRVVQHESPPRIRIEPVDESLFQADLSQRLTRVLERAKGPVRAEINVLDGSVREVRGFDRIGRELATTYRKELEGIEADVPTPSDQASLQLKLVGSLWASFRDGYMQKAMDILLSRRPRNLAGWSGLGGKTKFFPGRGADHPLLRFSLNSIQSKDKDKVPVEFEGKLEYQAGRLLVAQLCQSKPEGRSSTATWLRWSLQPGE